MTNQIEIKIRWNDDHRKWADIPVSFTATVDEGMEDKMCRNTLVNSNIKEIRWNYLGLSQGHYI